MSRPVYISLPANSDSAAVTHCVYALILRARPLLWMALSSIAIAFAVVAAADENAAGKNAAGKNAVDESGSTESEMPVSKDDSFAASVAPILIERCLACHGGDSVEGGYDIRTLAGISRPGDSAADPVVTGDPESSELYRRLITADESELMPSGGPRLTADEIQRIGEWIAGGAQPGHSDPEVRLIDVALPPSLYLDPPAVYPRPLPVTAVAALAGDGPVIIGGYRELLIWRDGEGAVPQRLAGFHVYISAIAIADDGRLAIAHGTPGRLGEVTLARLTATGLADRTTLLRVGDVPAALAFSPSGDHLAIATLDGRLRVIDMLPQEDASSGALRSLSPGFAGERAGARGDPNRPVLPIDDTTGATTETVIRLDFTPHADAVVALAWSPDGTHLLSASRDRTARVIRLQDGRATSNYAAHDRAVHGVSQIRAGALTLDETGTLRLWAAGSRSPMLSRPRTSDAPMGMQRFENTVLVPRSDRILRITVEQVEQDDGTDKDGKPKKKKVPRWKELAPLHIDSADVIASLAVATDGAVLAGTHGGWLYRWTDGAKAQSPASEMLLLAQPR